MTGVTTEQFTSIQDILKLADLKRTLKASQKIEKQGGELAGGFSPRLDSNGLRFFQDTLSPNKLYQKHSISAADHNCREQRDAEDGSRLGRRERQTSGGVIIV